MEHSTIQHINLVTLHVLLFAIKRTKYGSKHRGTYSGVFQIQTNWTFVSEANNKQFAEMWKTQHQLFGGDEKVAAASPFNEINTRDEQQVAVGLKAFASSAYERHTLLYNADSKRNISLPFLFANIAFN